MIRAFTSVSLISSLAQVIQCSRKGPYIPPPPPNSCSTNAHFTLADPTPRCCGLGQCEWVPDPASAVGTSSGDHREVPDQQPTPQDTNIQDSMVVVHGPNVWGFRFRSLYYCPWQQHEVQYPSQFQLYLSEMGSDSWCKSLLHTRRQEQNQKLNWTSCMSIMKKCYHTDMACCRM